MDIELVVQLDTYGCVIASIAMVTGVSYEDISAKYIAHDLNKHGYNTKCQNMILNDMGYGTNTISYLPCGNTKICILTVSSLNYPNSWHAVVYVPPTNTTHAKLLDSNVPGAALYTLEMIRNILTDPTKFRECTIITNNVDTSNKWTHDDCKLCTGSMDVVNDHALYGDNNLG
jgi:hypothetical protein